MQKTNWQPSASIENLKRRAALFARLRAFFAERDVMEVETPLLSRAAVTDVFIESLSVLFQGRAFFLQTSPEYAMKRLLAAGTGAIYQICKAFRADDAGRLHQPEFTMLEWYRPGFDHHALMDEMDSMLQAVAGFARAKRLTYAALLQSQLGIDPHRATTAELQESVKKNLPQMTFVPDRRDCLDLLLTFCTESWADVSAPLFIYDFPVEQAALARVRHDEIPKVASRFEVYVRGIELANGFHELQDAAEQRARFMEDLVQRQQKNMPSVPIDRYLLNALESGLPDCAGVALGVDRLLMLAIEAERLSDVMSFDFTRV